MLKLKNGYKKTKFGFIPDDWEIKRLKDIGTSTIGLTYSPSDVVDKGGTLVLRSSNINDGRLSFLDNVYVKKDIPKKLILKKGDILVCSRNGSKSLIGKNALIAEDTNFTFGAFMSVFRSKYNQYLYQLFQTEMYKKQIVANLGATINQITTKDINSFQFPFPKNDKEQKKIVSILSTWDKAIELKEKLIEQKKEQKKGLMQKLLTGEVRLPGFKGTWEIKRIKNISKVSRGASPRPISDPKWFDLNSKIGWVRISDVTKSKKTLFQTEQYLSDEGVKKSRLVEKGNIIMSICATVGKPIVTGFNVCIHDGFVVFDALKINRDYFYYALLRIENYWEKYGQTGSQMNLNTDIVGNEKIMFPNDYDEQKAIAEVLMNADKEIELIEDELEYIKQQKKGLMQLLLTGKVRVQV
ncbi:restriction endonuclease subunit S [Neobacillus sp.]|uniref:restriction endonuclease subunit S n=1 Tax=Neobacillus sp. TaxID=2675273 RepID=UPI0035B4FC52